MLSRRARIFVLSSPSGGGKTTLGFEILKKVKGLVRSVSMTTRHPRQGERNGRDYLFVTQNDFKRVLARRGFLEHAVVHEASYGTPRAFVEKALLRGKDVLLLIDVQGAFQIRKRCPQAVLIFIMPPSLKELRARLVKRSTETPSLLKKRLKTALREMAERHQYDYIIVNRHLQGALEELKSIIMAERLRVIHG